MTDHSVTTERLLAWVTGELSGPEAAAVKEHVRDCRACARRVERMATVAETVRADAAAPGPSEQALARVHQSFEKLRAGADGSAPGREQAPVSARDVLRRIVASLVFDGGASPAWSGARGEGAGGHRAWECEVGEVDLQLEPPPARGQGRWRLLGQIACRGDARASTAGLAPAGAESADVEVPVDEHGVFELPLDPGRWDVHIRVEDALVVVPDVRVP